jgi:hypothetical protein
MQQKGSAMLKMPSMEVLAKSSKKEPATPPSTREEDMREHINICQQLTAQPQCSRAFIPICGFKLLGRSSSRLTFWASANRTLADPSNECASSIRRYRIQCRAAPAAARLC